MRKLKRTLLVSAGVLLTAGPAPAFYFNGWPGSGEPIRRSLVQPNSETQPGSLPPGGPPASFTPGAPPVEKPPPVLSTPPFPGEQPPPEHVPEPATGLIGLLGLSAVALARRWRRKQ
jgi:hypothetical protein